MSSNQFVILARGSGNGQLAAIGSRREIIDRLACRNTMADREGGDVLYGPGITIQLPPSVDPITQMLMSINEEEIAWQVIRRLVRELDWKLLDPETGRELGRE